jgi:hypothetical protein
MNTPKLWIGALIFCLAGLALAAVIDSRQASMNQRDFEAAMATAEQVAQVRARLAEEQCDVRILAILENYDMTCFGTWTTADGPIKLEPMGLKVAK